jgi:hypothetical protein
MTAFCDITPCSLLKTDVSEVCTDYRYNVTIQVRKSTENLSQGSHLRPYLAFLYGDCREKRRKKEKKEKDKTSLLYTSSNLTRLQ